MKLESDTLPSNRKYTTKQEYKLFIYAVVKYFSWNKFVI